MLRRPTLSERSVEELRAMAAEYRRMAGTGSTPDVTEALLRVLQPIWDRSPETAKRLRAASKESSMPPRCATSGQATTPAIGDHWEDCHA